MSESGIYFESSDSDSDFSDEEADYDDYSLGEYYDEEEELYNEYEESEEEAGVREYEEEYSDGEPEIVTSDGGLTRGEVRGTGGRSGVRSRVWDLSVLLAAFCLAIIFGYYSL